MPRAAKPLKIGILGVGATMRYSARGFLLAHNIGTTGAVVSAVCDCDEAKARKAAADLGVEAYTNYDRFLEHDMDAVLLANYFHQHAPYAVQALKAGKHVLSETTACFTMAEGVQLVEAVEKSGLVYMLIENYAYFVTNMEMRRLYQSGTMGEFRYGEGEYVHPMPAFFYNSISPGKDHWRNWMPMTYYCTHSLAPLMFITDTMPVQVNALVVPHDPDDEEHFGKTARRNDLASVILATMDNGAVVKILWGQLRGLGAWTSVRCRRGMMENLRAGDTKMLRIRREPFDRKSREPIEQVYLPDFPKPHEGLDGHAGADQILLREFVQAVTQQKQPFFDVHRAVAMSAVGIQAYRSALAGGTPMEIPDLHLPEKRRVYRTDDWSAAPEARKTGQPWPSVRGDIQPSPKAITTAKRDWNAEGFQGE